MATNADIKKFLPQNWLQVTGKNIPALIAAINTTHETIEQLIQACIDQLFIQTASGRFLIQLGEQSGFTMPANSGLDITAYETLVPIMVSDPKQVRTTINELIQAFYTSERTNALLTASVPAPYNLSPGDDLIVETESGVATVSITNGQVSNFSSVSAGEIAAVLNSEQAVFKAESYTDQTTGLVYLRLLSNSSGVGSKIRIAGGKLQNVVQFPTLIATLATTGTTWNLTKTSPYTDQLTFTWNGAGTNPNVYLAKAGDTVTIRGLVDGAAPFYELNGSYVLVDVGYDYFIIRNDPFNTLTSTLVQNLNNNIIFTSSNLIGLYNQSEYAFTSESDGIDTITITVPAIPPLSRRFLAGSAHLHGSTLQVIDFTRQTVTVQLVGDEPVPINNFILKNDRMRANFREGYFDTVAVDTNTVTPTYTISSDIGAQSLPFTISTPIGTDPVYGTVGSSVYKLTFPFPHGLQRGWGFTLSGATGAGNVTAPDLNSEHQVVEVLDDMTLTFNLLQADGSPLVFSAIPFSNVDVYQYGVTQADGADFYMQFPSSLLASVFAPGMLFRFDPSSGTPVVNYLANQLLYKNLAVVAVNGNIVDFRLGVGTGPNGLIISNTSGERSGGFGGTASYFLDTTSTLNQDRVFAGLLAVFMGYTQSSNPLYVGSFLYDPTGYEYTVTVSKFVVNMISPILKGDNIPALFVNTLTVDGQVFPQTGQLVLDYGTDSFEGPINYIAVIQNGASNQILIDPAYKFKNAHDTGASVQFIESSQVFTPDQLGTDLPVYITGTSQARNTMFALAELLTAAGIFVDQNVLLPDLRYADPAIVPFD